MVSTPRKRHASRSPEHNRAVKRPLASASPEEGELDDPVPPTPPPELGPVDSKLPFIHAQIKITMKRPHAPGHHYSPLSLDLAPISTAQALANGTVRKNEKSQREEPQANKPPQETPPRLKLLRRREVLRRPQKQEIQAYGHKFIGCGLQSDYDVTTKLGEGTFGFVVFFYL